MKVLNQLESCSPTSSQRLKPKFNSFNIQGKKRKSKNALSKLRSKKLKNKGHS